MFEPRAEVDHRVSHDRVEWAYLRRRSWAEGLSKAAVSQLVGSDDALSTERDYVAKVLPAAVLRELRQRRVTSAAAVVTALAFTTAGLRPRQAARRDRPACGCPPPVAEERPHRRSRASSTTAPA